MGVIRRASIDADSVQELGSLHFAHLRDSCIHIRSMAEMLHRVLTFLQGSIDAFVMA